MVNFEPLKGLGTWVGANNGVCEEGDGVGFCFRMKFCYDMDGWVLNLGSLPPTIVINADCGCVRYSIRSSFSPNLSPFQSQTRSHPININ